MMSMFEKTRSFVYRYARPLDLARWQIHFENGSAQTVIQILAAYQNEDGGFGYALEPDCWNPNSTPIATWFATEVLREIGWKDATHPIVEGILRYLESGADFDDTHRQWLNVVPANNDHPHATWWTYGDGGSEFKYNPTASLAGFIIRYADPKSELYQKGVSIAKEAFAFLEASIPFDEQHVTTCFCNLYDDCIVSKASILDMNKFSELLRKQVKHCINPNYDLWFAEYHTKPSDFILSKDSMFYEDNKELLLKEHELLRQYQSEDGGFPVTWQWWTDYPEQHIATAWWRAYFAIQNMLFLENTI